MTLASTDRPTPAIAADLNVLPELPHWETPPQDLPAAIREVKAALRARITASGRSVEEVFAVIEERVRMQVEQVTAELAAGQNPWPVIDYADIADGAVY